jgi:hypothetical protein
MGKALEVRGYVVATVFMGAMSRTTKGRKVLKHDRSLSPQKIRSPKRKDVGHYQARETANVAVVLQYQWFPPVAQIATCKVP